MGSSQSKEKSEDEVENRGTTQLLPASSGCLCFSYLSESEFSCGDSTSVSIQVRKKDGGGGPAGIRKKKSLSSVMSTDPSPESVDESNMQLS